MGRADSLSDLSFGLYVIPKIPVTLVIRVKGVNCAFTTILGINMRRLVLSFDEFCEILMSLRDTVDLTYRFRDFGAILTVFDELLTITDSDYTFRSLIGYLSPLS